MSDLTAIDIALLPPPDIAAEAVAINAALPPSGFQGLRLDASHLPHITLTQQFVATGQLEAVFGEVATIAGARLPVRIHVRGAGRSRNTVWMAIERTAAIDGLHEALMDALLPFERSGGTAAAFAGPAPRPGDVQWVSSFRTKSSYSAFNPHITLGHCARTPHVEPREFLATRLAVCHLGRFCTCQLVLADWNLNT